MRPPSGIYARAGANGTAAWAADRLELEDGRFAQRPGARGGPPALDGPSPHPAGLEEPAGQRSQADPRPERRSDLRDALLQIDGAAERLLEAKDEPQLIRHEDGQVGAADEDG